MRSLVTCLSNDSYVCKCTIMYTSYCVILFFGQSMHLIKFDQTQYDNTVTNLLSFPLQTDPLTSPQTSSQVPHSPYPLIPSAPNSTMPSISVSLSLKPMSSLSSFLSSLSSLPHTVRDTEVPLLFREPYILSGYRPVGHSWSFYFLSLFQIHNETINVWSHLLAGVCVALRFSVFAVMCGGVLQYFFV